MPGVSTSQFLHSTCCTGQDMTWRAIPGSLCCRCVPTEVWAFDAYYSDKNRSHLRVWGTHWMWGEWCQGCARVCWLETVFCNYYGFGSSSCAQTLSVTTCYETYISLRTAWQHTLLFSVVAHLKVSRTATLGRTNYLLSDCKVSRRWEADNP